jgi:hypothetical protein
MRSQIERRVKALETGHDEPSEIILEWFYPEIYIPPRPGVIYVKWADDK